MQNWGIQTPASIQSRTFQVKPHRSREYETVAMTTPSTIVPPGQINIYKINHQARKTFFTTSNPFEQQFGYHRAIRRGQFIFVSGTTALKDVPSSLDTPEPTVEPDSEGRPDSKVHYPTDAKQQAMVAMRRCVDAVEQLGGQRADIVRVKMFVAVGQPRCDDQTAVFAGHLLTPNHSVTNTVLRSV